MSYITKGIKIACLVKKQACAWLQIMNTVAFNDNNECIIQIDPMMHWVPDDDDWLCTINYFCIVMFNNGFLLYSQPVQLALRVHKISRERESV